VGLPTEAVEETEPAQGHHVRNRFECPSPANKKRPRTCLAESGQIAARTNERDNATGSCCNAVKKHDGHDEEDSSPSLVTSNSSTLIGSDPSDQEVIVQEEATPDEIPSGWTRAAKLEPSPANRKRLRTCLAERGQTAARTNQSDNATGSCSAVKKDAGGDEEDSSPSLVTSTSIELIGYDPSDQEVVQEEEATPDDIPAGWTRTKLEPDW
jgi:hypothetical protein